MDADDRTLDKIRAMYAEYLAKKQEYREAQMLENCVVWEPPKTAAEALRRYSARADVDRFLERCRIGLT